MVRMLVESIAKIPYHRVLMDPELLFTPNQHLVWKDASRRLLNQEPIQYVTGTADFLGFELHVEPGVLIPRPETEELAAWVETDIKNENAPAILDIGTGSGCIPVYLKLQLPQAKIHAIDVSSQALKVARTNAALYKADIDLRELNVLKAKGNEFQGLQAIVSNPPYIPAVERLEMDKHVLEHEPETALFVPDESPLLFYNRIAELGLNYLAPGGHLYFEIHELYGNEVLKMLEQKGYTSGELRCDLQGKPRMTKARRPFP